MTLEEIKSDSVLYKTVKTHILGEIAARRRMVERVQREKNLPPDFVTQSLIEDAVSCDTDHAANMKVLEAAIHYQRGANQRLQESLSTADDDKSWTTSTGYRYTKREFDADIHEFIHGYRRPWDPGYVEPKRKPVKEFDKSPPSDAEIMEFVESIGPYKGA